MGKTVEQYVHYFNELNPNHPIGNKGGLDGLFKQGIRIGIYGSSFDPITNVHLWTASTVAHRKKLDYIIFLPSNGNRIDKTLQTNDEHRQKMVEMAIADNPKFILDTYEFYVPPGKQYTYYTMQHFKEVFPNAELFFVIGADLLVDIAEGKWRMAEELVESTQFIVMARNEIDMLQTISKSPLLRNHDDGRFQLLDKGLSMEISSTYIREELAKGGEPRYLVPDDCYNYMKMHNLYNKVIR
ncbi:nicotinate (nicotinamide) nucleotide adenylyltransferase [Bacillus massiliigorillae]|uniref:nicotinate (nicotinamide) nucleotide adenylyltransferase n=1 Tax=Bacillus massiliigorillae TaxID=1243664 RepID=UPI0003A9B280|nr:nicotinate (nicotinamide) nucleotide adenylyltransferase [Bacillus massiliigorillae]